jgi:hypothetical protein
MSDDESLDLWLDEALSMLRDKFQNYRSKTKVRVQRYAATSSSHSRVLVMMLNVMMMVL